MCLFIQLCFLPLGFWHSTSGCEIDCLLLASILVLVMIWLEDKCFLPFQKKPKILPLIHLLFLCFFSACAVTCCQACHLLIWWTLLTREWVMFLWAPPQKYKRNLCHLTWKQIIICLWCQFNGMALTSDFLFEICEVLKIKQRNDSIWNLGEEDRPCDLKWIAWIKNTLRRIKYGFYI